MASTELPIYYEFNYYTAKWIANVSYSIHLDLSLLWLVAIRAIYLVVKVVWVQVQVAINKIENTLFYASQLINQNNSQIKSFDMLLKKSEPHDKIFD